LRGAWSKGEESILIAESRFPKLSQSCAVVAITGLAGVHDLFVAAVADKDRTEIESLSLRIGKAADHKFLLLDAVGLWLVVVHRALWDVYRSESNSASQICRS